MHIHTQIQVLNMSHKLYTSNIYNTLGQMYQNTVGCLKITEDKSSKSRIQTPDAKLVIATSTGPRREG